MADGQWGDGNFMYPAEVPIQQAQPSLGNTVSNFLYQPTGAGAMTPSFDDKGAAFNAPSSEKIMGMTPNSFSAVAGGIGNAFAPKDSWQQKLGLLASSMGNAAMRAEVEKNRHNAMLANTKELFKNYTPEQLGTIASHLSGPDFQSFLKDANAKVDGLGLSGGN